jgi:uncharacterized protein
LHGVYEVEAFKHMTKLGIAIAVLAGLALAAVEIARIVLPGAPSGRLFALFFSLSLSLAAFVALTDSRAVRWLRRGAAHSAASAIALPLLLLVPYLIYAFGTRTFSWTGLAELIIYILLPTILLLPDRLRSAGSIGWRDGVAMAALAVPVSAGWMGGIWRFPIGLPVFRPLFSVCAGGYAFLAVRKLEDVGYRLLLRKQDFTYGLANFAGFVIVGIPAGYALRFIRFHPHTVSPAVFIVQLVGIYIMIAIPEEFLFRGILQNFVEKSIRRKHKRDYALILASVIFGLSHLHHPPVPNWRYGIMATLAGLFYGNAYRERRRLSACAFTHALVDATWHFWF